MTIQSVAARARECGFALPPLSQAAGAYVSFSHANGLVVISGQICVDASGAPAYFGRLGENVNLATAQSAAQSCALSILAQLDAAIGQDLSRLAQLQRLGVFVACTPTFTEHSEVGNAASRVMIEVLGTRGQHARTSVGVSALPRGVCVEIDAIAQIRP